MTGNSVLLNTNILSALLQGDVTVADHIDNTAYVYIPVVVIGELYYGAQYSTQIEKNLLNIQKLIDRYEVLKID